MRSVIQVRPLQHAHQVTHTQFYLFTESAPQVCEAADQDLREVVTHPRYVTF